MDIYRKTRNFVGEENFVPFTYQGQYYDEETGLAYNRFRYYDCDSGTYISQDPIGLAGGMPNMYAYVHDSNGWIDPLGLECQPRDSKDKFMKKGPDDSMPGKDFEEIIVDKLENNPNVTVIGTQIHTKTDLGDRYMDVLFMNNRTKQMYHVEVKGNTARRSALQKSKDALIDKGEGTFGTGDSVPNMLKGNSTKGIKTIVSNPKG